MRVYKNSWFVRFARKEKINDDALRDAIDRTQRGLIDADLGGGLIKQRIARVGEGKSGGYRSIIIYKSGSKAFFVFGFAKRMRENLTGPELLAYKQLAAILLPLTDTELDRQIEDEFLVEMFENE